MSSHTDITRRQWAFGAADNERFAAGYDAIPPSRKMLIDIGNQSGRKPETNPSTSISHCSTYRELSDELQV